MSFKGNNLTKFCDEFFFPKLNHNCFNIILFKVPTYALDNAFQRNRNIVQLYLGANPWRCNCLFAPAFQVYPNKNNSCDFMQLLFLNTFGII